MKGSYTKQRFKEFVISQVLPQMNPFPSTNSVLVFDNAKIHHDQELLEYLDAFEVKIKFLSLYLPDLNPIETAFSTIKQFLRRNRYFVDTSYNPIYPLLVACSQITPQMTEDYFRGLGYF
ncbi:hypothetical protein RclHR1_41080001 [Rhizophagus clarus]|nr:hypothetical protein RclHR1_41080001 [Rhizophagus clarus]